MHQQIIRSGLVVLLSLGALQAGKDDNNTFKVADQNTMDTAPTGKGNGPKDGPKDSPAAPAPAPPGHGAPPPPGNGINYHNGPVMTGTVNVYYIWYGTWATDKIASTILTTLAQNIGSSPYFNINGTYYQISGATQTPVSGLIHYAGSVSDNYSQGKNLSDNGVAAVVSGAFSGSQYTGFATLPVDPNGVYFVLTSSDVNETSGFCKNYCGWHTYGTLKTSSGNVAIKFAFVGNPARCPSACTNGSLPPNGDVGPDGMASIIAHELSESVTDPQLNAWYDSKGNENADKCAWNFGATKTVPAGSPNPGSLYNVTLGGLNFLIQQNWVNANGGKCALSYP